MGVSKTRKRRKRRQTKSGAKPIHKLRAGRTGQVRFKQRAGMRKEQRRFKTVKLPPVPSGMERQWVRCRECKRRAYYDYIPYSLSNPIMTLPCGHGAALRFSEAVEYCESPKAVGIIMEGE